MPSRAWNVRSPSEGIPYGPDGTEGIATDTVYYDMSCDREYVRRSLIEHDGYPSDIVVAPDGWTDDDEDDDDDEE